MNNSNDEFEAIILELLITFNLQKNKNDFVENDNVIDFEAREPNSNKLMAFEVKFYKSKIIPYTTTLKTCYSFAQRLKDSKKKYDFGILISSSLLLLI